MSSIDTQELTSMIFTTKWAVMSSSVLLILSALAGSPQFAHELYSLSAPLFAWLVVMQDGLDQRDRKELGHALFLFDNDSLYAFLSRVGHSPFQ